MTLPNLTALALTLAALAALRAICPEPDRPRALDLLALPLACLAFAALLCGRRR
jgi:hypothetical protein